MSAAQKIRDARLMARLSINDLARLSGVSASTISRAEAGKLVPSVDAYFDILTAAGFTDGGRTVRPLSSPSSVWAARWLLGDLATAPDRLDEWIDRWRRIRLVAPDGVDVLDIEPLLFRAGRYALLSARPGAVDLSTDRSAPEASRLLSAAGVENAVTGDEALERLGSSIVPTWPVLYVADVRAAVDALGVRPRLPRERGPRSTVVPFDGWSETGRVRARDGVWFVSPLQAVVDGYAGYGRMTEQAEVVVRSWETT
ncbi:MAG: helix-turn-helix domain-containing protein [Micrococcales bacterium]|nr:helix-turn-helix domain-containing protein [Micrococcales bacterium]